MENKLDYKHINDVIRPIRHELADSWINDESLRFTVKGEYERIKVKLHNVPGPWKSLRFNCRNGHSFTPNWLEKTPPFYIFKVGERLYRQINYSIFCTVCGSIYIMPIKQTELRCESPVYGDEAFREVDGKTILCYSFIGFLGSPKDEIRFKIEFDRIKKYLAPMIDPDDWVLHLKELLSGDKRRKINHLAHLNKYQAVKGVRLVLDLVAKFGTRKKLQVYSASTVVLRSVLVGEERVEAQSSVYNSALLRIIGEYTDSGIAPMFYFERTNKDGWAKNLFDGGRLTLLWIRLTNGLPVKSPEFVLPSFSYYLEIADVISFVVARELFAVGSTAAGKPMRSEFASSRLGRIKYIWTDDKGGWNQEHRCGIPLGKMGGRGN